MGALTASMGEPRPVDLWRAGKEALDEARRALHKAELDGDDVVLGTVRVRRLLDHVEQVLDVHQPVTDPDGEALCTHCVHHDRTFLWPCNPVDAALRAVGALGGTR